jgi:hypothetical protein
MKFSNLEAKHYLYNSNLKSILEEVANGTEVGRLMSNPTLAIGTSSAAKVKTSAFDYIKDGEISTVASAETAFTATTHDITADADTPQEAIYVVSLDPSDDSISLTMGDVADEDEAVAPSTPTGELKLGEVKIQVADGSTDFDASTDLLSAGHLTDTYTNKTDIFSF